MNVHVAKASSVFRDFPESAYGPHGEAWRWRLYGYGIMLAGAALAVDFYIHFGMTLYGLR